MTTRTTVGRLHAALFLHAGEAVGLAADRDHVRLNSRAGRTVLQCRDYDRTGRGHVALSAPAVAAVLAALADRPGRAVVWLTWTGRHVVLESPEKVRRPFAVRFPIRPGNQHCLQGFVDNPAPDAGVRCQECGKARHEHYPMAYVGPVGSWGAADAEGRRGYEARRAGLKDMEG